MRRRRHAIEQANADPRVAAAFVGGGDLTVGHGLHLDERTVELPWTLAQLGARTGGRSLDAGSALNHEFLLAHPAIAARDLTIATLAPERDCFWQRRISYNFCDLRALPFRDAWFDEVICVSTLEHVGFDNSGFAGAAAAAAPSPNTWQTALRELARVVRPGGVLLLTLPFGRAQSFPAFQQFDSALLAEARGIFKPVAGVESYFRYFNDRGWSRVGAAECATATYAAESTAVAGAHGRSPLVPRDAHVAAEAVVCCAWTRA
ncbi:MAG TPA: methyltransferase domain-containing protein [Gemmatimonadaceae bacterium]|nr:methyltransferase domain-containing protein [Gemmatimonadaceae bacterium]